MDKKQKQFSLGYFLMALFFVWLFSDLVYKPYIASQIEVPYSTFLSDLEKGNIDSVSLESDRIVYAHKPKDGTVEAPHASGAGNIRATPTSTIVTTICNVVRVEDPDLIGRLTRAGVTFGGVAQTRSLLDSLFGMLLPFLPLLLIWYFIFKKMKTAGGGVMSLGQNKAQEIQGEMTGVKFADVGGVGEAEVELREIIDFLKDPARFDRLGAKLPKGVLLVGPPGTGKTMLAKATAGEAGVPFFLMTGSGFVEMFVGVGAARVRDLFEQAKKRAPCLIFIDEIDAIGQSRAANVAGSNSERENTLNQLLAEMDGFVSNTGVVIMGATNRPEILDQALIRPGRFDRQVQVVLPTEEGRLEILKIHTRKTPLGEDAKLESIAKVTPGFSGAELANIVNEASLLAVRRGRPAVTMADFDLAIERVVAGLQRKTPLAGDTRRKVAYHETGHALTAYFLPHSDRVHKISIIPTAKGALGYTLQMAEEDQYLIGEADLRSRLAVLLGGRAAELLVFGEPSTGASNDLERATELARRMTTEFGMSAALGPVRYANPSGMYLQTGSSGRSDVSPETVAAIDGEIRTLIREAQDKAQSILLEHGKALHEMARILQEREVVTGDEIAGIVAGAE
ncbi:MAG: ATP-dependent zinc metalloprotease FtsH [Synergistaceae bacterium]|nr:ATP-dependent zinc metalloprotease FtsH [Synergistaceae bacterium]